ncbi:DNA-directed DNA polymerase alpha catalytic subunit pol1 [Podospora pseudocomata]|uniref:DNA polymerase n=1 Tax=Podospora pseudocomata TaxID=2093779 RepID=A0ABR0G550_9PEZI|nr:DNA-directed DNA polymerase alpha catalytic subunit pol1 [Podospora pseudocomata]
MSRAGSKRDKFAELRALRESGKKKFDTYEVEEVEDLYEEVDENQYKKIVRQRLNEDDFVVDDNGEGYADDGREEWDRIPAACDSESEDGVEERKERKSKKQRDEEKAKRDANDRNITEYFTKGATKRQPKPKVVKTEDDDKFLADLLGEVDANVPAPVVRSSKKRDRSAERRTTRALSPAREARQPAPKKKKVIDDRLSSPSPDYDMGEDNFLPPAEDEPAAAPDVMMSDPPLPSSPAAKVAQRRVQPKAVIEEEEEDEDMMEVAYTGAVTAASVNISASRPVKKIIKAEPLPSAAITSSPMKAAEPAIDASSWNGLNQKLNVVGSSQAEARGIGKIDYKDAIEEDGSLNLFWTDYTEVNGSLCLFGKVLNKKTNHHVSCFVKIDNILRKLYFLPRKTRVQGKVDTGEEVEMMDVYNEVDAIMTKKNVGMYKIKACTRKYAFELPDVPQEGQYLKLLYPYTKAPIDMNTTGETFSHVFGTNTALFEQFVLWKNIKGPCWLKIEDADFGALKNSSHCRLEVLVDHPNMVAPFKDSENVEAPPLTLMSIALRTIFNAKANKQEILAISARIYEDVSLSDTTPADKLPCRTFTVVRPQGTAFPLGFETMAKERKRGLIKLVKEESAMLSFFLAQVDVVDPDVIMGHQLEGVDYSILLNRLHEKKTHQWSRLGRLRRSQWPASMGKVGGNVFAERQIMSGRLLCDLANDAGKSVMMKCQSWSLTEMCNLYLPTDVPRRDLDNEAALKSLAVTKDGLMDYISHAEIDTYYVAALALRTQILPLTKVLTNLAGNSWARTLTGTRAERNEYILLHEFHRNKYICPDKEPFKGRARPEDEEDGGDAGKKKDKYKGGLVFEPEKGLYDKFVLVMDFNSLYPSIIQEYNICFTTVDRTFLSEEDGVPQVPEKQDLGVLPRLIATLVDRRRQVKSLMKDKTATPEQLATWDIKQLALKLTANSMYGCLGYTKSRFYARPLAVLTTFKGREVLRSTKDLAESMQLQVIYGDTDSVMINANVDNVADALRVGREFKAAVNGSYKKLEIDIDNIFRRILLQAKKKYAAVNLVETDGKYVEKMEIKGLDMKRREYCPLSREISKKLLDEILSGNDIEDSVQKIHDYLREISSKMREGKVQIPKYIILTQLGKSPTEYGQNGDTMPQIQVALREMARGKTMRKGDVVSYIITGDVKQSSEHFAKRAYTPQDVLKAGSELSPDVEWYIGKQIFPPVERLCANITGTSTSQLAENLGLDPRRFANNNSNSGSGSAGGQDLEIHPLESQIPDQVRFANCKRLLLRCRACKGTAAFEGLLGSVEMVTPKGLACPSCSATLSTLSIVAQVEAQVREQTSRYYEGWLVCGDADCGNRTRQMSVYGDRCLGPKGLGRDCMGRMRWEFGERDMYNQLVYFASLFDVDKAKEKATSRATGGETGEVVTGETRERVMVMAEHNRVRFGTVKGVVDRYLDKCGRQWVAMDALFGKLGFVAN